ncbi:MAG: hypothetical protein ABI779_04255 [Acidobacteriota bacterium]
MKKTSSSEAPDELRPEYDLEFKRPNRFAKRLKGKSVVAVVLDEDVADVFQSSEAVNELLRSVIKAMPSREPGVTPPKRRAS